MEKLFVAGKTGFLRLEGLRLKRLGFCKAKELDLKLKGVGTQGEGTGFRAGDL